MAQHFTTEEIHEMLNEARRDERRIVADHIKTLLSSLIKPTHEPYSYLAGYQAALKVIYSFLEEDK